MKPQVQDTHFSLAAECSLVKAQGQPVKSDNVLCHIEGLLSTQHLDTQGETLFIKGMDIDFLKSGYAQLNWWHHGRKDPGLIVGLIDYAEKRNNDTELFIKGHLFKSVKASQDVFDLMQALESEGKSLGMSVEGAVLKREKSKVYKSSAFGGALTTQPVNRNCFANILKAVEGFELGEDSELSELSKAISAQGNSIYGMHALMLPDMEGSEGGLPTAKQKKDTDLITKHASLDAATAYLSKLHPKMKPSVIKSFLIKQVAAQ